MLVAAASLGDTEKGHTVVGSSERPQGGWAVPSQWGVLGRGIDVAGGQGEHEPPYGARIKSVCAGTPEQGWGDMGHPMLEVRGPEWESRRPLPLKTQPTR